MSNSRHILSLCAFALLLANPAAAFCGELASAMEHCPMRGEHMPSEAPACDLDEPVNSEPASVDCCAIGGNDQVPGRGSRATEAPAAAAGNVPPSVRTAGAQTSRPLTPSGIQSRHGPPLLALLTTLRL